jgi:hypothetical protein
MTPFLTYIKQNDIALLINTGWHLLVHTDTSYIFTYLCIWRFSITTVLLRYVCYFENDTTMLDSFVDFLLPNDATLLPMYLHISSRFGQLR